MNGAKEKNCKYAVHIIVKVKCNNLFFCLFVCLFFYETNKLRAIWVGRLGTLAKETLALKVEVEVVLLCVKPWLHPFVNWHWKVKKKKKRKGKEKEWKERNFARLKYKNYYLNRRALLQLMKFWVCAGHVNEDEFVNSQKMKLCRVQSFILPFFIQKNSVISVEGG